MHYLSDDLTRMSTDPLLTCWFHDHLVYVAPDQILVHCPVPGGPLVLGPAPLRLDLLLGQAAYPVGRELVDPQPVAHLPLLGYGLVLADEGSLLQEVGQVP